MVSGKCAGSNSKWLWSLVMMWIGTACGLVGERNDNTDEQRIESTASAGTTVDPDTGLPIQRTEESIAAEKHFGKLPYKKISRHFIKNDGPDKPNVVLFVIDTINPRHMGVYGYGRNTTPNLQRLANQGMLFTNHISNSSWTRPSFTTIITGMTKKQHGVELRNRDVRMDITTVAEHFRLSGYRTAGFTGNPLTRGVWGFEQGYQKYVDTANLKRGFPPDRLLTDEALEWLSTVGGEPFFLKLFFTAPHAPYRPVQSARHFIDSVKSGNVVEYPFREYKTPFDIADQQKTVAAYDDEVRYTDRQIGAIIARLHEMGVKDKTAILVTGDHGEMFGQHGCYTHAYHMWEEAIRVPLVVMLPWQNSPGVMVDELTTHVDILPTLLDVAHIANQQPQELHGVSLFSTISDGAMGNRLHYSQYNAHGIQRQTVRKGKYKLIHSDQVHEDALERVNQLHEGIPHANPRDLPSLARSLEGAHEEMYDLIADPGETKNILKKMKQRPIYRELKRALSAELEQTENDNQMSPEILEALQNAGYIQ